VGSYVLSRVWNALFSEPAGRPQTLVVFSGAVVLSSLVGYGYVVGGATLIGSLAMAVGFALSGIVEAVHTGRRRTASGLRISAIVMLSRIGGVAFAPEYVV
jgi:hypothetical protein